MRARRATGSKVRMVAVAAAISWGVMSVRLTRGDLAADFGWLAPVMPYALLLVAIFAALPWQVRHFRRTQLSYEILFAYDVEDSNQFTGPFYAGAIVVGTCAVYGLVAVLLMGGTERVEDYGDAIVFMARGFVFWSILYAKTIFGPTVACYLALEMTVDLVASGRLEATGLIADMLNWVFLSVPSPLQVIYSMLVIAYGLALAAKASDFDMLSAG